MNRYEILNLATEVLWTVKIFIKSYNLMLNYDKNYIKYLLICISLILHTPCSVILHSLRICDKAKPNTFYAKLDQTSIIISCLIYHFITYKSIKYPTCISVSYLPVLASIPDTTNKQRVLMIGFATGSYLMPIMKQMIKGGIWWMLLGAYFHLKSKYGTIILHLTMIPYHNNLINCI